MPDVRFTLNGEPVRVETRQDERLLETLRVRLGLTSLKDGCHPQGQCGACLAIVNGHPRVTCTEPTAAVEGGEVLTLEGLSESERARIVRAFEAAAAGQCGFCLPAIALHAHAYLQKHPEPTRAEVARGLDMHLCRCGGYGRIVDAIENLARLRRGEAVEEKTTAVAESASASPSSPSSLSSPLGVAPGRATSQVAGGVGAPIGRFDTAALVLGMQPFSSDLKRDGMLHGALVLSAHARARVLHIDTSVAAALPGVRVIATARDVPGERWQGLIERDWPLLVAEGEEVRCAGDVLVAIAADSEATARAAADLVAVDYEIRLPVLSPEDALAEGAPRVNPAHDNLLGHSVIRRGDAAAALAASAHVARATFHTQRIEHLFLEPECALAEPRIAASAEIGAPIPTAPEPAATAPRLPVRAISVFSQGQGIFDDRRQIASILGLPEDAVTVTLVPPGGAFGGKEDLLVQGHAALLALLSGRPVRLALSREQSIRMHPKRHPISVAMEVGCDADGNLTAVRARILGDSGAYASVGAKVLERAAGHACGPYRVPHVDVESRAAYTNHPPSGAMRGFGVPQITFALEGCVDELASRIGLDRWEIRLRNAVQVGDMLTSGQRPRASVGIRATLLAVKPAYDAARAAGRAVGIACGIKNSGLGNGAEEWGRARLLVEPGPTVALLCGYSELGQGLWTALAQIAAESTGLDVATFRPRLDTRSALSCGQTTGSRAVLHGGRAVIAAAAELRAELDHGATLAALVGRSFGGDIRVAETTPLGAAVADPNTHTSYGFATQLCVLDEHGHLARIVAAHDVGRAINPSLCVAQVEGAVVMGLGYALTEELVCEHGIPVTTSLRELGALRARDVPEIDVLLVEDPEPEGPFGAKGVGEIGLVPTAAAVASALRAFDGVQRTRLPMRDSPAAKAMHLVHPHPHAPPQSHAHAPERAPAAHAAHASAAAAAPHVAPRPPAEPASAAPSALQAHDRAPPSRHDDPPPNSGPER